MSINHSNGAPSKHGAARYQSEKVRVAIVGVGNCASAFVQGVNYYSDANPNARVPGLMHVDLGGYHVRDIEFTAAFDIDAKKVGKDLGEAIWAGQNNTIKFAKVPKKLGVPVYRGMTHDGLGKYLSQIIEKAPGPTADVIGILKERKVDVMIIYLPVGSEEATKWYVEQALAAGVGVVNCIQWSSLPMCCTSVPPSATLSTCMPRQMASIGTSRSTAARTTASSTSSCSATMPYSCSAVASCP